MKNLILSFGILLMASTMINKAEAKVCLNEVGMAAYKFAKKNLQTNLEEVGDYPESSISSVRLAGGVMDELIYVVKISGRMVSSARTIIGPAEFSVIVNVKPDCKVTKTVQN